MGEAPTTKATLGGFPLLGSSVVTWELIDGVIPYTTTVEMDPGSAAELMKVVDPGNIVKPTTLRIESGGHVAEFQKIYVIGLRPSSNPFITRVMLADRRWLWKYAHIGPRRYNWRRNVSFKRLEAINRDSLINDVIEDVWYAPWSLPDGGSEQSADADVSIWKASEILDNVLKSVVDFEFLYNGESVKIRPTPGLDEIPVENLLLDGSADQQIARTLGFLPQLGIFIDETGRICPYRKFTGEEKKLYRDLGGTKGEKIGEGHIGLVDNRLVRPRAVNVWFTIEAELRFDFLGDEGRTTTNIFDDPLDRTMFNVLPSPDFESPVTKKPAGTWIKFQDAISEWKQDGSQVARYFSFQLMRRAFCPFLDIWGAVRNAGLQDPDVNWGARVNGCLQHYRRTFQLHPKWWSRILSIHARRVSLIDKETGSTAPAGVWADFCRLGTERSFFRSMNAGSTGGNRGNIPYCMNYKSYPAGSPQIIPVGDPAFLFSITKEPQAEARVTILDKEQGVIAVDYLPDVRGIYETVLPSMMQFPGSALDSDGRPLEAGPGAEVINRELPFTFDAITKGMSNSASKKIPELSEDHRVAVVLTATPAVWNRTQFQVPHGDYTDNTLYKVTIDSTDQDLKHRMNSGASVEGISLGLDQAHGPEMNVRIGPGVEVAKVAWVDSRFVDIQKIFGIHEDGDPTKPPNLKDLVLNDGFGDEKGASLRQIALAVASSVYAEYANHLEGSASFGLVPGVQPTGWMDSAGYELSTTGEGSVKLDMPTKVEKIDMDMFMGPSTKATIAKLVRPD